MMNTNTLYYKQIRSNHHGQCAGQLLYIQQQQQQQQWKRQVGFVGSGSSPLMMSAHRLMHHQCDEMDDGRRILGLMVSVSSSLCLLVCAPSYGAMTNQSQRDAYDLFVQGARKSANGSFQGMKQRMPDAGQRDKDRIADALALLLKAKEDQANGEYSAALGGYTTVIQNYSDLALSERARVGRALMEYQLGMVTQALLHLNDEEIALRGDAEVHAALASVYYVEKPGELSLAEEQWDIASEFDTRYSDLDFVRDEKHWPPRLVEALKAFLTLT
jgi:hypothetical protein